MTADRRPSHSLRMSDPLYHLFRMAWPSFSPSTRPPDLVLEKRKLTLRSALSPVRGTIVIVLEGELREFVFTSEPCEEALVATHVPGRLITDSTGELRATKATTLLLVRGWNFVPEFLSVVSESRSTRLREMSHEIASLKAHRAGDRLERFLAEHPEESKPTRIALEIGCSREMASRLLKERRAKESAK